MGNYLFLKRLATFFYVVLITIGLVQAQNPGGVGIGLQHWVKADAGYSPTLWSDQSSNGINLTIPNAPTYTEDAINFNPAVRRTGAQGVYTFTSGGSYSTWKTFHVIIPENYGAFSDLIRYNTSPSRTQRIEQWNNTSRLGFTEGGYADHQSTISSPFNEISIVEYDYSDPNENMGVEITKQTQTTTSYSFDVDGSTRNRDLGFNGYCFDDYQGYIAEQIFYSSYTPTMESQVRSYLATKYGLTTGQNYLASDGSTIYWNNTTNSTNNNDVFGIGRDDNSALNQKVSKSVNSDAIITMALDNDFTSSNVDAARTTTFTNNISYLMLGNDNASTASTTTEVDLAVYTHRIAREWKVQATNFTQAVNLKFEGYESTAAKTWYVLKDADGDFSAGYTELGALDENGEITGVTLANNEYITLVAYYRSPGGVANNLALWLRADDNGFTTTDLDAINASGEKWYDQSPLGLDFPWHNGSVVYHNKNANFNPSFEFYSNDHLVRPWANPTINGPLINSTQTNMAVFDVTTYADGTSYQCLYSTGLPNNTKMQSLGAASNVQYLLQSGSNSEIFGATTGASGDYTMLSTTTNGSTSNAWVKGELAFTQNIAYTTAPNEEVRIGGQAYGGSNNYNDYRTFEGFSPEIISYSTVVNAADLNRIHSYLAVKYGVTMGTTASPISYTATDGSTVYWTGNATYQNDVFGIGYDDKTGLNQKISKSVNNDAIVTIALDNDFSSSNQDASRTTEFDNDISYLMIGNDDATLSETTVDLHSDFDARVTREWFMQSTNFSQTVNMKFEGYESSPSVTWVLLKNTTNTFSALDLSMVYAELDYNGEVQDITLNDGDYFTLAKIQAAPGGVSTNLELWLRADEKVTLSGTTATVWNDISGSGYNANKYSGSNPQWLDNTLNYNPVIEFDLDDFMQGSLSIQSNNATVFSVANLLSTSSNWAGVFSTISSGASNDYNNINSYLFIDRHAGSDSMYAHGGIAGDPGKDYKIAASLDGFHHIFGSRLNSSTGLQYGYKDDHLPDGSDAYYSTLALSAEYYGLFTRKGDEFITFSEGQNAEVIQYEQSLSDADYARVNSYLALKYGISVGDVANTRDYVGGDGTTVYWTGDATYQNDVFGLGRDVYAGIAQKVSHSYNSEDILTLSINPDFTSANYDASREESFDNLISYFVVGNDNADTGTFVAQTTDLPLLFPCAERLNREWKAQLTDFNQAVNLQFDLSGITYSGTTKEDFILIIDTDGDGNFETGTQIFVNADTLNGSVVSFFNVTGFVNGSIFTIITNVNDEFEPIVVTSSTETTMEECGNQDWLYFVSPLDNTKKIAAIRLNGETIPADSISAIVNNSIVLTSLGSADNATQKAVQLMNRFVQFNCPSCGDLITGSGVDVRLYWYPTEKTDAGTAMDNLMTANSITGTKEWEWFKVPGTVADIQSNLNPEGIGFTNTGITWATPDATGTENSVEYVEFYGITSFSTFGGGWYVNQADGTVLPVELISFTAKNINNTYALVEWKTATELNNDYFVVESSTNGIDDWTEKGQVSGNGTSNEVHSYSFEDYDVSKGIMYYRLKQVDFDGTVSYSNIEAVKFSDAFERQNVQIYPNPADDVLYVSGADKNDIEVYNYIGKKMHLKAKAHENGFVLNVSDFSAGVYFISINGQQFKWIKN